MAFITYKQFNAIVAIDKDFVNSTPTMQWKELPQNKIFRIAQRREVTKADETTAEILTLVTKEGDSCNAWAPKRLQEELKVRNAENLYVRSNGIKICKTDPEKWYYNYNLVETTPCYST